MKGKVTRELFNPRKNATTVKTDTFNLSIWLTVRNVHGKTFNGTFIGVNYVV